MIGIILFFSIGFGAIALGMLILGLTFRQWYRQKIKDNTL